MIKEKEKKQNKTNNKQFQKKSMGTCYVKILNFLKPQKNPK